MQVRIDHTYISIYDLWSIDRSYPCGTHMYKHSTTSHRFTLIEMTTCTFLYTIGKIVQTIVSVETIPKASIGFPTYRLSHVIIMAQRSGKINHSQMSGQQLNPHTLVCRGSLCIVTFHRFTLIEMTSCTFLTSSRVDNDAHYIPQTRLYQ